MLFAMTYSIDRARSLKSRTVVIVTAKNEVIELKPREAFEKLQALQRSGQFYMDKRRVIVDFFSRLVMEYMVEEAEGAILVHPLLNNRPLSEYELILQGVPLIAMRGQLLSFIDDSLGWQDIAPFLDGPRKMTREEYRKFKKDVVPERLIEFEKEEESPVLQLVDKSGSFANLLTSRHEEALLRAGFVKKDMGKSKYYCPTDKSLQAIKALITSSWKVLDEAGREVIPLQTIEVAVDGHFVDGKALFGSKEVALRALVQPVQAREKFVLLDENSVGLLSFEGQLDVKELLEYVQLSSSKLQVAKKNLFCLQPFTSSSRLLREPDTSFQGILRPYQQEGLTWLLGLYEGGLNGLLADEMGLGKTVQVLAFLSCYKAKALIIAPTSLLENWMREILHFLPQKKAALYRNMKPDSEIIITSYALLRQDIDTLKTMHFDMLILDEAQAIKNSATRTYQAVLELNCPFRLLMTGTPVENSVDEVVNHFDFLEPGLLDGVPKENLGFMRKKIAPFFLRRKKSDVAKDLPEKVDERVFVEMAEEQKRLYDNFLAHFKANLLQKVQLDGITSHRMEVFEAILRLRQIACHPLLMQSEVTSSAKFDQAVDDIQTLVSEGKKVLVFSQFTSMLQLFAKELTGYLLLEGQTKNRQSLVDTFQNDPNYPIFLISLKAGGVGLNLTKADYVLLFDPWWNSAQEAQAIDRAHRIGRKDTVFIKRYYSVGSIEEKVLALQEKKSKIASSLFDEQEAANLTLDDLEELLY